MHNWFKTLRAPTICDDNDFGNGDDNLLSMVLVLVMILNMWIKLVKKICYDMKPSVMPSNMAS